MPRHRNKVVLSLRIILIAVAVAIISSMLWAWRVQVRTTNVAQVGFGPLRDHNGYIQVDLLRQHPTDELFDGELFLYYPEYQNPPAQITINRNASGRFASSVIESSLVPWSKGKAFPKQIPLGLPTPGLSHRQFPFDSPYFDFTLNFNPPIRPSVVRFVNRTDTFLPVSGTLQASWNDPGNLTIRIQFIRNPFVKTAVVILGIGATAFGILLVFLKTLESLATATASYFLSLWSLRGIVDRTILSFPTYLDMWLLALAAMVLLIVSWRVVDFWSERRAGAA
jgi:hypothetical protein